MVSDLESLCGVFVRLRRESAREALAVSVEADWNLNELAGMS
jgi:hypothetical protein